MALAWPAAVGVLSGALLLLVLLPIAGLLFTSSPGRLLRGLRDPLVGPAIRLTVTTTVASVLLIVTCGTPLAWLIARGRGRLWRVLETVIQLPVVLAQSFVAAPFYVQAAVAAFRRLDPDLVLVARTLGASRPRVFFTVAVPLSWPALAGGAALSWARALGEFGATLMFAGNLTGRTQTLPLTIYTALESDLQTAQSLSIILVAVAFALLVAIRAGGRR